MADFGILGSVEVCDHGRPVGLGGLRERALLARLLLSANYVVSADRLASDLWSGEPPPHSAATLRVYISRLRTALGPAAGALLTHPPGYRLNVGDDQLDATRFERLANAGRADLAAGNPARAAASLREALGLWRGPPLLDVADLAFAQADVARLEEARLAALEDRITADLACGRHAAVIGELDGLVAGHPLRERFCGQQILALYRCGRQAQALNAYHQLRTRLAAELGVDPTPELRRLYQAILRQEPELDWQPVPGSTPAQEAIPARPASTGRAEPAKRQAGGVPDGGAPALPAETTSFIGRADQLNMIEGLLGRSRLLTLTGPGGSGKSRLALRAAARLSSRYADGAWLVQLAAIAGPELVMPAVASALGAHEAPGEPLLATITARFRDREALLILDNCEHVIEPVAEVIGSMLGSCAGVRILATSQSRLRVEGEAAWPVPPLTVPGRGARDPESVLRAESARLFCDRAALARPGFSIPPGGAAAVAEICRRLDGIPLAIELAAARVSALTVRQLLARLDDRFRLLTGGSRTGLPRHRTLQAAVAWSHDLLSPTEQLCFRRLAVFAGGSTIEAAEAVCADDRLPAQAVFDTVTSLVDRSLLTTQERFGSMRYGMLESIRQFAGLRLDEADERTPMCSRHLDWFLTLVSQADLDGPDQGAWLDLLAADHDNLVASMEWSLSAPTAGREPALQLATALAPFWKVRGYAPLGLRWLDEALTAAGPGADPRLRAAALDGAGLLAGAHADFHAQRDYQDESLAIWRSLGDDSRIASSLGDLGSAAHTRADYAAARAMYEEALGLARRAGDARQMARSLSGLGVLRLHQGDLTRATAYFEEGMARFAEVGDLRRATLILGNLGVVAINAGDFDLARTRLEEHLGNVRRLGDRKLTAGTLTNLGMAVHHLGDLDRAERLHQQALELTEQIGDRRISAVALTNLGLVAYARKDFGAAVSFHQRSLALAEAVGEPRSIAESLEELAEAESAQGRMERAAGLFGAAEAIREAIGAPIPEPDLIRYNDALAATELALGREWFARARNAGRGLSMTEAVQYARGSAQWPAAGAGGRLAGQAQAHAEE